MISWARQWRLKINMKFKPELFNQHVYIGYYYFRNTRCSLLVRTLDLTGITGLRSRFHRFTGRAIHKHSLVWFAVSSHTPVRYAFYHTHTVYERNQNGSCLVNLIYFCHIFFQLYDWLHCVESWWNMPLKRGVTSRYQNQCWLGLLTHICVTRSQWVDYIFHYKYFVLSYSIEAVSTLSHHLIMFDKNSAQMLHLARCGLTNCWVHVRDVVFCAVTIIHRYKWVSMRDMVTRNGVNLMRWWRRLWHDI